MSEKTCNIVAQYVQSLYATTNVRPYENKLPVQHAITAELTSTKLAEPGYHRVELGITVTGSNTDGVVCVETGGVIEGIVKVANLTHEEMEVMLLRSIPGTLLGSLRAAISTISLQTGYGPITLPPLTGDQLFAMSQPTKENDA